MELGPEVRKQQIGCRFESSRSAGRELGLPDLQSQRSFVSEQRPEHER